MGARGSKPKSRTKPKKTNTARAPRDRGLRPRDVFVLDDFTDLIEKLLDARGLSPNPKKSTKRKMEKSESRGNKGSSDCPYDVPVNIIKTEIYRFVIDKVDSGHRSSLREVLEYLSFGRNRVSFEKNPFHLALGAWNKEERKRLPGKTRLESREFTIIKDHYVARFAMQMLYAYQHNIPPDLLTGFIYQCGSPERIRRNMADRKFEPWLIDTTRKTKS